MKFQRCFIIEPNLKKSFGHVIEFPFTLQGHMKKIGIESFVICNKQIEKELLNSLKNTYPFISEGCFDDLTNNGEVFKDNLNETHSKFKFNKNDLVINLTSYTNQILGVSKFLNENRSDMPTFCLWFHQIYPPTKVFTETLEPSFRKLTEQRLSGAFAEIRNNNNVQIFTTLSDPLKNEYEKLSQKRVYQLPLPYSHTSAKSKSKKDTLITFGLLGDGRYEKGALLTLKLIEQDTDKTNNYIIENIFPRGYSSKDMDKLNNLKNKLSTRTNIEFIDKPLSNEKYKDTFSEIDVFLMPYHPKSYDKRVSGIFIEATMRGIPVIVSENTWMAEQVKHLNNGVIFNYNFGVKGLHQAAEEIILRLEEFRNNATVASKKYNQIHSPESFIDILLNTLN